MSSKKCCFFIDLKSGCLAYAFWSVVFAGFNIIGSGVLYYQTVYRKFYQNESQLLILYSEMHFITTSLRLVTSIILCIGISKMRTQLFYPHFMVQLIETVAQLTVLCRMAERAAYLNSPSLIITGIMWYSIATLILRTYFAYCLLTLHMKWLRGSPTSTENTDSMEIP